MGEGSDAGFESSVESTVEADVQSAPDSSVEVTASDVSAAYSTLEGEAIIGDNPEGAEKTPDVQESNSAEASVRSFDEVMAEAQSKPVTSFESLTEKQIETLTKPAEDRSWSETEVADSIRHPEYATQLSFTKDDAGNIIEAPHGEKGSHRPDGIRVSEDGIIDVREVKDYHSKDALMQNMAEQAADRYAFFGKDTDVTFAIAVNDFTVEEAAQLQDYVENTLHAKIDWINK